jgi:hypothetical protein
MQKTPREQNNNRNAKLPSPDRRAFVKGIAALGAGAA